jgi:hypothetical protein
VGVYRLRHDIRPDLLTLRRQRHQDRVVMTDIIRAELSGSDTCIAEGITVRAAAPVLAMCRKLMDAEYTPTWPLHAYRGDVLCLKVRSIWEGSLLECQDGGGFRRREGRTREEGAEEASAEAEQAKHAQEPPRSKP